MVNVRIHDCDNDRKKQLPLSKYKILIVEGRDDCNFFRYFLKKFEILDDIQIFHTEGKSQLEEFLKALILQELFVKKSIISIGIVRDADTDPKKEFDAVVDILKQCELPYPSEPFEVTSTLPKISILLMPNATNVGTIEDLCLESIADTNEMKCVDKYFECLSAFGINNPDKKTKVKISVFLSSKSESCSIGVAAQKGFWDFEHTAFTQIRTCLVKLFRK